MGLRWTPADTALAGNTQRVLNHVLVVPQDPSGVAAQLAVMEQFHCEHGVAAWELYPGFNPGLRVDDPGGLSETVVRKGLELGMNRFCVHQGLPIGNFFDTTANYPDDVGPFAVKHSDAQFIVYHAAICAGLDSCGTHVEGPYHATSAKPAGTDALIRTVLDNGISPGGNVYAETGTAFEKLMAAPDQAAHLFGKLLRYLRRTWLRPARPSPPRPHTASRPLRSMKVPVSAPPQAAVAVQVPPVVKLACGALGGGGQAPPASPPATASLSHAPSRGPATLLPPLPVAVPAFPALAPEALSPPSALASESVPPLPPAPRPPSLGPHAPTTSGALIAMSTGKVRAATLRAGPLNR